ncbi:amino acid ABC transporter permease [Knoellia sp. p5-6-4]|uniref:amino acid ABC transporter permease n=1 Tax=unclassified Knoellia TaxID=2618719 RepID=UPI0023D9A19D|nr:amino acid ABC transporter permease [Knoellia sp. p5-6-4]MDF2144160.1 amino acid ABC transporter permease [Knoellia sp. p5-6-4]
MSEHITTAERPGRIDAVPVRHPLRWVAVAVIAVLIAMFVNMVLTNEAFNWSFVFEAMQQNAVLEGLWKGTILVTVLAMLIGISGGIILAVMRLSPNPVLSYSAWVFTWFFRSVPRLVLLTTMGALGILFQGGISFGVPFDTEIMNLLGIDSDLRFLTLDANQVFVGIAGGAIGLGLSEAAYMAEIARAGILSVDEGQREAAEAIGMSSSQTMRRIVLPQAMRVIVPPTGNETIAMVKDTSLLIGLPLITELFFQLQSIGSRTYQVFPSFVAAILFYLVITSAFMVGQYFLEKRFGRGFGQPSGEGDGRVARLLGRGAAH